MDERVKQHLITLNQEFYGQFARSFAETRGQPQPGFSRLLEYIQGPLSQILDVGCGEGRFGRFLLAEFPSAGYTGVDFTEGLLNFAAEGNEGSFLVRDLSQPGCLDGLGKFEVIACLAVLQHIPGQDTRVQLLAEMGSHLAGKGRVFMSNWQFMTNARQRRKVMDWSKAGLHEEDVEPNDYLLSWQRDGFGHRYVAYIDENETNRLAVAAGLKIVGQYREDGREGDLNLYTVLVKEGSVKAEDV